MHLDELIVRLGTMRELHGNVPVCVSPVRPGVFRRGLSDIVFATSPSIGRPFVGIITGSDRIPKGWGVPNS